MARLNGSIATETLVTVPIRKDYIMGAKGKSYVFMQHVQAKVYHLAVTVLNDMKLYQNFTRAIRKGLYNIVKVYGLDAIDIETPQFGMVSVRLKFKIVKDDEGENCTAKSIKKSAL